MKIKLGLGKTNMEKIAEYCGGELYDFTGDLGCEFEYVCTDSREACENTMFVATRGERVDGHDYISDAIDKGCRCILCEYVPSNIVGKQVCFTVVENSVEAFAHAAKGYRENALMKTVAVTGSVGKTTTKELVASILRQEYKIYSTVGNFNSVIGMPMSLMEADSVCNAAVFEMGMSNFGEIHAMSTCARPDIAMVINIGSAHLEYLKTRENIARAKLEIADGLVSGGYLLLAGDEPILHGDVVNKIKNKCKIFYVGRDERQKNDILVQNIRISGGKTLFDLKFLDRCYADIEVSAIGSHFALNAAFAASAAFILGCNESSVRAGLASYVPGNMRQNMSVRKGITVIADCYNASPESMRAAINVLSSIEVKGKRIAVLGDMRELGKRSDLLHLEIGKYVVRHGVDMLFTMGESGALIAEGAIKHGMRLDSVFVEKNVDEVDALAAEINAKITDGDAILFKASRALRFERIIETLFE